MKRKKKEIIDGISPDLIKRYSSAIRKVWSWSSARRLAIKRATNVEGFTVCESCRVVAPKVHVDHIVPCGDIMSDGFMERLNVSSHGLQVLCPKCHRSKTKKDQK